MKSIVDFCAVALGAVFEWSGVMKVVSRDGWKVEGTPFATGIRVIDALIRRWLPWAEIVIGLLLVVRVATTLVAVLALSMLVAFTVAVVRVLSTGQRPPCLCFGSSRARPVSWRTVARNVVLMALAVTTIVGA